MASATLIGSLSACRIYSAQCVLPGKWTVVTEGEYFGSTVSPENTSILSSVTSGVATWVKVKKEIIGDNPAYGNVRYYYEGGVATMPSTSLDKRTDEQKNNVHGMEVGLRLAPIGMHPKFDTLQTTYGGYLQNQQWMWPVQNPTSTTANNGTGGSGGINLNPMYGVQDFYAPICRYKRSYMTIGQGLPNDLSTIGLGTSSPNGLSAIGVATPNVSTYTGYSGWYWIKSSSEAISHGNDLQVTETWESGGIGGFSQLVYPAGG